MKTLVKLSILLFGSLMLAQERYTGPIIDMHLHDYREDSYYVAPNHGVMSPPTYMEFKEQTMQALKDNNIVKAVVSTIGGEFAPDTENILHPGYHAREAPTDTVYFKKLIQDGKLKVFGEIGAVYAGKTLSDPEFAPYLKICEANGIPVAVHTGGGPGDVTYRCCPNFRLELGDPYKIEDVLAKYPKLQIYMMHAGEAFHEHAIRLMKQYKHLYTDLWVLLWINVFTQDYAEAFLKSAKRYDLLDRVMFGSDQMVWPHAIKKSIDQLNSYEFLTLDEKTKIFYSNAVQFLGLSEDEIRKHKN